MPSKNFSQGKPWRARIRVNGRDFYLGAFDTYAEADKVERAARIRFRHRRKAPGWNLDVDRGVGRRFGT